MPLKLGIAIDSLPTTRKNFLQHRLISPRYVYDRSLRLYHIACALYNSTRVLLAVREGSKGMKSWGSGEATNTFESIQKRRRTRVFPIGVKVSARRSYLKSGGEPKWSEGDESRKADFAILSDKFATASPAVWSFEDKTLRMDNNFYSSIHSKPNNFIYNFPTFLSSFHLLLLLVTNSFLLLFESFLGTPNLFTLIDRSFESFDHFGRVFSSKQGGSGDDYVWTYTHCHSKWWGFDQGGERLGFWRERQFPGINVRLKNKGGRK